MLKIDDFPVFGNPMRRACISDFFIPCFFDLPAFFDFSIDCFNFLYLVLRFARIASPALCFGTYLSISPRHSSFSSEVVVSKNLFSAVIYSGD